VAIYWDYMLKPQKVYADSFNDNPIRVISTYGPVQCLPVGGHDKRPGTERFADREGSPGRTGSDCGDQGEGRG